MIQEGTITSIFANLPPGQGVALSGSTGHDLNPDFGNGQNPRKAHMPGQSDGDLALRVDVTANFTEVIDTPAVQPLLQFHAVLSTTGATVITGNDFVVVGSNVGPFDIQAGASVLGYNAAELTVGKSFFIRVNPWVATQGRSILSAGGADLLVQDLRYFGVVLYVPQAAGGSESYFSTGITQAYFVKNSEVAWNPGDFAYPSAVSII